MAPEHGSLLRPFSLRHYYGDTVRELFLIAAVVIFLYVPFASRLPFAMAALATVATAALIVFAGLTNPRHRVIALIDAAIAGLGCVFFELVAVAAYGAAGTIFSFSFLVAQFLAVDFLAAFYFSIKTVRSMSAGEDPPEPPAPPEPPDYSQYTR